MKIGKLSLENFSCFDKADIEFSPGLNVLLGPNACGKTHVLKLLYATLRACHGLNGKTAPAASAPAGFHLYETLAAVFRPEGDRAELVIRQKRGRRMGSVRLSVGSGEVSYQISSLGKLLVCKYDLPKLELPLFIPAVGVLSIYEGLIAAYESRELAFDQTFRDLCVALSATKLRGRAGERASRLLEPIFSVWDGRVSLENGRFYVASKGDGKYNAHLLSEGFRKIAALVWLIQNGSLTKNKVLFWDEPMANLNPYYVTMIAQTLLELVGAGIQVFISTHDYLLSNELSLHAEYKTPSGKQARTRFIALHRKKLSLPVTIESGPTLDDIENNPIQNEFQAHYDRELLLRFPGMAKEKGRKK